MPSRVSEAAFLCSSGSILAKLAGQSQKATNGLLPAGKPHSARSVSATSIMVST